MKHDVRLTTLNVSLPRGQREFVVVEAARTGCTTTSEYIRRLIREAEIRSEQEALDRKLLAGLDSGDAVEITPAHWEKKRRDLLKRHRRRRA